MRQAAGKDCSFRLSHYEYCLRSAKEKGYFFARMKDHRNKAKSPVILLRHDVDSDPEQALNFSEIEKNLGIKATYFFRVHSKDNLFDLKNYHAIRQILEDGHEIGLHAETDFAGLFGETDLAMLARDKVVLEAVVGGKLSGICMHEPARSAKRLGKSDIKSLGFAYDAYDPRFLKELKYISDSSCRWREGCMCQFIEAGAPHLYILTHPVWWFKQSPLENY